MLPSHLDQVPALVVGGEGGDAELRGEGSDLFLAGPDPLTTHLDDLVVANILIQKPAADPRAGLEDKYRYSSLRQASRRHQARQAGPHDRHARVEGAIHRTKLRIRLAGEARHLFKPS